MMANHAKLNIWRLSAYLLGLDREAQRFVPCTAGVNQGLGMWSLDLRFSGVGGVLGLRAPES